MSNSAKNISNHGSITNQRQTDQDQNNDNDDQEEEQSKGKVRFSIANTTTSHKNLTPLRNASGDKPS